MAFIAYIFLTIILQFFYILCTLENNLFGKNNNIMLFLYLHPSSKLIT